MTFYLVHSQRRYIKLLLYEFVKNCADGRRSPVYRYERCFIVFYIGRRLQSSAVEVFEYAFYCLFCADFDDAVFTNRNSFHGNAA